MAKFTALSTLPKPKPVVQKKLSPIPEVTKHSKLSTQPVRFVRSKGCASVQPFYSQNNHTIEPNFESQIYKNKAKEGLKRRMEYKPTNSST